MEKRKRLAVGIFLFGIVATIVVVRVCYGVSDRYIAKAEEGVAFLQSFFENGYVDEEMAVQAANGAVSWPVDILEKAEHWRAAGNWAWGLLPVMVGAFCFVWPRKQKRKKGS